MKDKIFILCCLCFTLLMGSCDKCKEINCSTGPPRFTLELVDKETGENVFTSGKYKAEDIVLTDENQQTVYTQFVAENNLNVVNIALPDTEGEKELKMRFGGGQEIIIRLDVRKGESKCCTNYFAENIQVDNFPYEQSKETGIIEIKI